MKCGVSPKPSPLGRDYPLDLYTGFDCGSSKASVEGVSCAFPAHIPASVITQPVIQLANI